MKRGQELSEQINQQIADHPEQCKELIMPVKDALDVLGGKWKLQIIVAIRQGAKRYSEIKKTVGGISDRMLSKELKELEMHQLIARTVYDAFPPVVEYNITEHGKSLDNTIHALRDWGIYHRAKIVSDCGKR